MIAVRNFVDIGENLQKIAKRLLANDNLVKLLYYTENDPYSKADLTEQQKLSQVFNKLIKIIPFVTEKETARSIIAIRIDSGTKMPQNTEFYTLHFSIEVFVPWSQWFINDTSLRPFAILGEIQSSLRDRTINGLGRIEVGDFELSYSTDDFAVYTMGFRMVAYD